ncbi:MAG: DUF1127 domain-containing protein [Bradyrhizobium sp.]
MSTINDAADLKRTTVLMRPVLGLFSKCWDALQQWRRRDRLRTELYSMSDRELMDIGTTRGEIDYLASKRGIDRGGGHSDG